MKKLIEHVKVWNHWRKHNMNSWLYKLGVLFGFVKSPTFFIEFIFEDYDKELIRPKFYERK